MALAPSPSAPRTVALGPGHLGVTLSNHLLGVKVDAAHEQDSVFLAGIRVGDVIVAIDGVPVSDHSTACDLLGSNLDKPVVLHQGPEAAHLIQFYAAAIAAQMVSEQSSFGGTLGQLLGGNGGVRRPSRSPEEGAGNTIGVSNSLAMVILAVVAWWLMTSQTSDPSVPHVQREGEW